MAKICDFPCPIYALTKNLIPHLWPDSEIIRWTAFVDCFKQALNRVEEGKAQMGEERRDEEVASSKKTNKLKEMDWNGGKMTKIDTQFMTKMAEKPYPLGPHIPI